MKFRILISIISLTLLLVPYRTVYGENLIEYTIQINSDCSAVWIIKQTGTNITDPLGMLSELRKKVTSLVEAAQSETGRNMAVNEDTMSISSTFSGSHVTVEYRFDWENFSKIENARIIIGDVFEVEDFFLRLYGYGTVYIAYPSQYTIEIVSPKPYKQDESLQILVWLGTTIFKSGEPRIILREKSASSGFLEALGQNAIPIVSLAVLISGFSVGFYMFRRRKKKETKMIKAPELPSPLGVESDEEKTLKLLKSYGGSLYQSAITEQCGFSRAKTSQLLAVLENKGLVIRYKKGRGKIVVLVEQDKK